MLWILHYFLDHLKLVIYVDGVLLTDCTGLIKVILWCLLTCRTGMANQVKQSLKIQKISLKILLPRGIFSCFWKKWIEFLFLRSWLWVLFFLTLFRSEWRKPLRAATPDKDSIKSNKRKRDNKFETVKPGQKEPFKSTSNDGLRLPKRSRPEESRKGKKSGNKSFVGGGGKRNVKMSSTQNFKASSKSHKLKRKFQRN